MVARAAFIPPFRLSANLERTDATAPPPICYLSRSLSLSLSPPSLYEAGAPSTPYRLCSTYYYVLSPLLITIVAFMLYIHIHQCLPSPSFTTPSLRLHYAYFISVCTKCVTTKCIAFIFSSKTLYLFILTGIRTRNASLCKLKPSRIKSFQIVILFAGGLRVPLSS